MNCYICGSDKGKIENHHYDCREGTISPETVPLCRRCHFTYHTWGVEWFEDEYLDRAIEIENKRREIYGWREAPMKREDVVRSPYWYKKHGKLKEKKKRVKVKVEQLPLPLTF